MRVTVEDTEFLNILQLLQNSTYKSEKRGWKGGRGEGEGESKRLRKTEREQTRNKAML